MIKIIRTSLMGLFVIPLAAQNSGVSVNGGLILGLDSLKKATNNSLAYTLGADYNANLVGTEIPARVGLSYAAMPGKATAYGLKTSLNLIQLHGDVFIGGNSALRGIAGISLNKYSMSTSGQENTTTNLDDNHGPAWDVNHHFPIEEVKGVKLGLRVGVEYSLSKQLALELLLQQTELSGKNMYGKTDVNGDPLMRQGAINPAWLQFSVTYRF